MVKITEQLIRKRSEHNESIISTLEELSLHQEAIEKIEHISNWCKDLQILYFQDNLISKIENLNKLKKLVYLNLALNNVEVIENLQGCESLQKLDLTLNFIGSIESVCSLKDNAHLSDLYLTGNPCADYKQYRNYVISKLPQLKRLDNTEITRSEQIKAMQIINGIEPSIIEEQERYLKFREKQRVRLLNDPNKDLDDEEFWKTKSENAPEVRIEISNRSRKAKRLNEETKVEKKSVKLYNKDGKPLNINQAKLSFKFNDEDLREFLLEIEVYKYLDSNLIDVDLQPIVVKVTIKEKIFQFVLPEEILTCKSTAQRSQTTGHLLIRMQRANYKDWKTKVQRSNFHIDEENEKTKPIYLEVEKKETMDFSKIVHNTREFEDNPEVPPLEYG